MVNYSLAKIVNALPFNMKYCVMLEENDTVVCHFRNLEWNNMADMLSRRWWNENTRLYNMAMSSDGMMIIHLKKGECIAWNK